MNDYFNIPQITNNYTFFALGSTVWQTWQKPKNSNFIYITALGGGAGGGGTPNTSGLVGGGGGGGSSSITKILLPAALIPDVLYINVGMGGIGGVGSNVGNDGGLSVISVEPNTTLNNVIIKSGTDAAIGGSPGTTVGAGDSGFAGTVFTSSVGYLSYLGIWSSYVGDDGGIGGGGGLPGSTINALTNSITTGGGGGGGKPTGGGTSGAGGSIIAKGILGRSAGGFGNVGGRGTDGLFTVNPQLLTNSSTKLPFATTGGAGGGGGADTPAVIGGAGGNGSYGSGGGGAGAGAVSPGGTGGNGGNGIVFITVF